MEKFKWNTGGPRKTQAISLGDAIKDLLQYYKLKGKYNEVKLIESWGRVMGQMVANRTADDFKPYIRYKKLHVKLTSATLRQELNLSKRLIIKSLNEDVGADVIDDIVFF